MFEEYAECVQKEISLLRGRFNGCIFDTVYIGGGTPSFFDINLLSTLISGIKNNFNINPVAEFTVEANPDSVTENFAKTLCTLGVNRISLGLQSISDGILKKINRPHTRSDFLRAAKIINEYFKNFNVDIMLGLPGMTQTELIDTLKNALDAKATHISVYGLILERGTALYKAVKKGEIVLPNDDETASMYEYASDFLTDNGFSRYEISNFAKSGYRCKHNLNYWDRGEYLGLGLAAHSFYNNRRIANTKSLNKYIYELNANRLPTENIKTIKNKEAYFEFVMLALRKSEGFAEKDFLDSFGVSFFNVYKNQFETLSKKGLLEYKEGRLFLPQQDIYISNQILVEFVP